MIFYGYDETRYNNQFLEAMRTAEQAFLRDTQSFSTKRDLTDNQVLSDEYKKAYIEMPNTKYDGGVIFSFMEETKKQGRDNVLFSPLLTAEENRAAFDSMRDDFKEKLKREFDKRKISYDDNLLNALSSRDSHKITMAIAQNGLKERDLSVLLNNNHSAAPKEVKIENYKLDPKKEKWFRDNDTLPYQNATMVKGNKDMEDAYNAFVAKKKTEVLDSISAEAKEVERPKSKVTAESLGFDAKTEIDNLTNMAILKAQTNRYYSLGSGYGGTEPRFDCSLWVRQTLEAQFKNYPNWSLSNKDMWTSEGIFKSCMNVAGSHEEYRNMTRHSLPEREQMLLDIVKKVGPGGIIATDKGPTKSGFDVNREYGIDHILRVVEKDGKLYMSHTTVASPRGTHFEPVEEWAHKYAKSVQNVFGVNGDDLRDGMANGDFKNNPKSRQYAMENIKHSLEDNVREFAMTNNIDPRVASAYIKYNDSYEKFAEAVKNIDDNPAATWKKLQDHLAKEAKDRGIEYHFDKNDGLIAKIFAALGMMFTQNMKDQENNVDMAKAQVQEMSENRSENRPETGGVTESDPNITTPPVKDNDKGIDKDDLTKVAQQNQQNNAPIKDAPTPAHENTLTF